MNSVTSDANFELSEVTENFEILRRNELTSIP